jgi:hypothetical protein
MSRRIVTQNIKPATLYSGIVYFPCQFLTRIYDTYKEVLDFSTIIRMCHKAHTSRGCECTCSPRVHQELITMFTSSPRAIPSTTHVQHEHTKTLQDNPHILDTPTISSLSATNHDQPRSLTKLFRSRSRSFTTLNDVTAHDTS